MSPTFGLVSYSQIDVPPSQGFVGLWAMVGSCDWTARALTDTVLYVIQVAPGDSVEATCLASSANSALQVGCSDDSNPPGGVGSAVYYQMKVRHGPRAKTCKCRAAGQDS